MTALLIASVVVNIALTYMLWLARRLLTRRYGRWGTVHFFEDEGDTCSCCGCWKLVACKEEAPPPEASS